MMSIESHHDLSEDERTLVEHAEHHAWMRERIAAEKYRKEMYQTITKVVIQWSLPVLLSGVLYWFQNGSWPQFGK